MGRTVALELTAGAGLTMTNAARAEDARGRDPAVVPAGAFPLSRSVPVTTDLPALREDHAIERTGEP